jgi:antirestriction protein ArdC
MPPFEAFRDAESYYATLAHEIDALDKASAAS